MKKHSYKIKHDFLFDEEDTSILIPRFDSCVTDCAELKLSRALNAKDINHFNKLIDNQKQNVVIIDDIGECINPASERYKQLIIRCICRKLSANNKNYFLA